MDESKDGVLLSVSASICDGAPVDWRGLAAGSQEPGYLRLLREMALVEVIANFHRDELFSTPASTEADKDHPHSWGRFTNLVCVGKGSFGAVYRAHDTKLETDVALKLLWPAAPGRTLNVTKALSEARMLARVSHPNVVAVHDTDYLDGRVGIWMEFIKGQPLTAVLRAQGPFSASEATLIGLDLCGALAAVHAAGLVHGDIKSQNVIREAGGRIVLMDFGAGKDATAPIEGSDFAGTPLYIAPEVFKGAPRSRISDIYSLGVLLFYLVTREYPVAGDTREDIETKHATRDRRYLRDIRPDLPPEFVRTVEKAIASDPNERYQSAGAFEMALAEISGRGQSRNPVPVPKPKPIWFTIAAAAFILAMAGVAYTVFQRGTAVPPVPQQLAAGTGEKGVAVPPAGVTPEVNRTYDIETTFHRVREGRDDQVSAGSRVAPGDGLFARVRVSRPTYVYIVNEDDHGISFLLFPLAGQPNVNPLTPQNTHRIPDKINWQVTSAGGREHFLVFASPERVPTFEEIFATLPQPAFGRPVEPAAIPRDTVRNLTRSVGGLTSSPSSAVSNSGRFYPIFTTPLEDHEVKADGFWIRQLTLVNPGR